ncbi:MAG: hypothetical protein IIB71_01405 [Proteobacteria bacterium]|nr:hypothetical protein [Pseudomonadota bacterium]
MRRPAHSLPLNTAGLEADVMRFMAIIAFCLIAIMALVKKIEPVAIENKVEAGLAPSMSEVDLSPGAEALINQPSLPAPVTSKVNPARREMAGEPDSIITPRPADEDDTQNVAPRTLTLRFDSDRTFLHLIATNKLRLYARTAAGFLSMDSKFKVVQSSPTGELYEVMHESIPRKITHVFEKNAKASVYLVALPVATKRDLDSFLDHNNSAATGALVIHKDGHISHES